MEIRIRKSVFQGGGCDGDFGWMIKQPEFARSLFIFNDNETQYEDLHQGRPSDSVDQGVITIG